MKNVLLTAMVVLCGLVPTASAMDVFGTDVGVTADLTFMSRYIWRGFNRMGSSPVWQPGVDFNLGNGYGASILASYAHNGGHVNATEYQYSLYYGCSVLDGEIWKTDYRLGWRYYDYIDMPTKGVDFQELFLEMKMPDLIGSGLVPHINYYYLWQARSGRSTGSPFIDNIGNLGLNNWKVKSGSIVQTGFDYNFTLEDIPDMPLTFSWDIVYNDGAGHPLVTHDWTHMLWGLKTDIQCPMTGGKLTPAIYFQNTFTRTLNLTQKDYLFCGITYSLNF